MSIVLMDRAPTREGSKLSPKFPSITGRNVLSLILPDDVAAVSWLVSLMAIRYPCHVVAFGRHIGVASGEGFNGSPVLFKVGCKVRMGGHVVANEALFWVGFSGALGWV